MEDHLERCLKAAVQLVPLATGSASILAHDTTGFVPFSFGVIAHLAPQSCSEVVRRGMSALFALSPPRSVDAFHVPHCLSPFVRSFSLKSPTRTSGFNAHSQSSIANLIIARSDRLAASAGTMFDRTPQGGQAVVLTTVLHFCPDVGEVTTLCRTHGDSCGEKRMLFSLHDSTRSFTPEASLLSRSCRGAAHLYRDDGGLHPMTDAIC